MTEQKNGNQQKGEQGWVRKITHEIFGSNWGNWSEYMTFRDFVYHTYEPLVSISARGVKRLWRKLVR